MEIKTFRARVNVKIEGDKGEFSAAFATLNVIDHDQDVTLPGAFGAQRVLIEPWNHNYGELPVGRGEIGEEGEAAIVAGRFFLDTQAGSDHYTVVKELEDLQEWSYSFFILESEAGMFDGKPVRLLKKLDVIGVGPVSRGAGIDTHTIDIKGLKPYPNEHACRLRDPGDFQPDSFRRITRETDGKRFSVIMGRLKGEDALTEQAYRYPKDTWSADAARSHCESHDGISFEPAEGESSSCASCRRGGKRGARHTSKEVEQIQAIHDHAVSLGAKCSEPDDSEADEETDDGKGHGEAGDGKPRSPSLAFLKARMAIEELSD